MINGTQDAGLIVNYGAACAGFSTAKRCELSIPLPLLAPHEAEIFLMPDGFLSTHGPFQLCETETEIVGSAVVSIPDRMEQTVCDVFSSLIDLCQQRQMHLHRIWNLVPRINDFYQGLERYRQFNIGRWLAFEQKFGRDLRSYMPAASAVGLPGDAFFVYFKAGRSQPIYFENPSQVPAYHYPADYGPRPPGFARGVVVQTGRQRTAYLSGTASIEGHQSIGEGDWHTQFRTTLHNMEIMFERMEMPEALGPAQPGLAMTRSFKCYLRHPEALPLVQEWMAEQTGIQHEEIMYLRADICRAELDLEIEGSVTLTQ